MGSSSEQGQKICSSFGIAGNLSVDLGGSFGKNLFVGEELNVNNNALIGGNVGIGGNLGVAGTVTAAHTITSTESGVGVPGFIGDGSGLYNLPPPGLTKFHTFTNGSSITNYGVTVNSVDPMIVMNYVTTQVDMKNTPTAAGAPVGAYLAVTRLSLTPSTGLELPYLENSSSVSFVWDGTSCYGYSSYQRFQGVTVLGWENPAYSEITFQSSDVPPDPLTTPVSSFYVTYTSVPLLPITPPTVLGEPPQTYLNVDVYYLLGSRV